MGEIKGKRDVGGFLQRSQRAAGYLAARGLGDVVASGKETFQRKTRCRYEHSFIAGTESLVCTKCGYIEPKVALILEQPVTSTPSVVDNSLITAEMVNMSGKRYLVVVRKSDAGVIRVYNNCFEGYTPEAALSLVKKIQAGVRSGALVTRLQVQQFNPVL